MAFNLKDDDSLNEMSEINVTPFIDVMLVLLIIFMATMPLATVNIPLNLPAVNEQKQQNNGTPIILSLNAENQLFLGNNPITQESVIAEIEQAANQNKESVIFFHIDKEVKYDNVMQLMNQLRSAGYLKIGLLGTQAVANEK